MYFVKKCNMKLKNIMDDDLSFYFQLFGMEIEGEPLLGPFE